MRLEPKSFRGCSLNDHESCSALGFAYSKGISFREDKARAKPYLEKSCSSDIGISCAQLGEDYAERGPEGMKMALALLGRACELGTASGCASLANKFRKVDDGSNSSRFVPLYKRACLLDYAVSCTTLADLYLEGVEVPSSIPSALEYFQTACTLDSGYGCAQVGRLTLRSTTNEEAFANAIGFLEKSCILKFGDGCYILSLALTPKTASEAEDTPALNAAAKGCELGSSRACHQAGVLELSNGENRTARGYFDRACTAGLNDSCAAANGIDSETP